MRGGSAGAYRRTRAAATSDRGALTRKIARQPKSSMRRPPNAGPRAVPIAEVEPSIPIALPIFEAGTVSRTNAMESAIISAAPSP
jgi:hypothetical protein